MIRNALTGKGKGEMERGDRKKVKKKYMGLAKEIRNDSA